MGDGRCVGFFPFLMAIQGSLLAAVLFFCGRLLVVGEEKRKWLVWFNAWSQDSLPRTWDMGVGGRRGEKAGTPARVLEKVFEGRRKGFADPERSGRLWVDQTNLIRRELRKGRKGDKRKSRKRSEGDQREAGKRMWEGARGRRFFSLSFLLFFLRFPGLDGS